MGDTFQLEQWSLVSPAMKTYLHVLALAISVACLTASPASEDREADEVGSGDGPEIIINEVVEKNADANEDENADETAAGPEDLLGMEMNPEDNEIKVNEKIGEDGGNKLDKKKCQKCIRSHYRARHADFCETCEKKTDEDTNKTDETSQIVKPNKRCAKCARKNFRARNEVFCSEKCSSNAETDHNSKVHDKKENNKKNNNKISKDEKEEIVETESNEENPDVKVSNIIESLDETTTEANSKKTENKHTKKNKKHKHKNKKKNKKHAEKEAEDMKSENDESLVESEEEEKDAIKLGPLENLIRFLIKTNTYTH